MGSPRFHDKFPNSAAINYQRSGRNEAEGGRIAEKDREMERGRGGEKERFRTLAQRAAINPNSTLLIMHADELSVARFSRVNQLLLSGRLFPAGECQEGE